MKLRLLTVLCTVYALLLLYASLVPFDLVAVDEATVADRLDAAWRMWPVEPQVPVGRLDAIINVLLYVPLAGLIVTRWRLTDALPRWFAPIGGVVVAMAVSVTAEGGQLFSAARTASVLDVLLNTAGGILGAVIGGLFGPRIWLGLIRGYRRHRHERPMALVAAVMLVFLTIDALSPLIPALPLTHIESNLARSHFTDVRTGLALHSWHHWIVARGGLYAVLTVVLGASGAGSPWRRWLGAAAVALWFALVTEACKPLIASRTANVANVLTAACGCLLGLLVAPVAAARIGQRGRLTAALITMCACIFYVELQPFAFVWDVEAMGAQVPSGSGWLPLYHYAMGARIEDIRLFVRTLLLAGGLAYLLMLRRQPLVRTGRLWRAALAGGITGTLGLILELGQFLLPGRVPSVTDVFCFALGGAVGGWFSGGVPSAPAEPNAPTPSDDA